MIYTGKVVEVALFINTRLIEHVVSLTRAARTLSIQELLLLRHIHVLSISLSVGRRSIPDA